jgi:diaminopimelate decarboxylase
MFSKELINKFKDLPTPFYYYDISLLQETLNIINEESGRYNYKVHYAIKANANDKILKIIKKNGLGADCVSGNEVKKSIEVGFSPADIVFAGVGKSDNEINYALDQNIFCFNCESIQEIEVINRLAKTKKKTAHIALRINPNIDAKTHLYITTGLEENKFGLNQWELDEVVKILKRLKNIKLIGLHFHIGSQITDLEIFKSLCTKANELQDWFFAHNIFFDHINVGGGLGVDYEKPDENKINDFNSFFGLFNYFIELKPGQTLHFELGRAVVAQCGNLISKVLYVKKGINTNFAILDAGMTELIRPALYQAYHKIDNISSDSNSKEKYDVVGPICETSDTFGKALLIPEIKRGDLIAIRSTGAYGEVMSSNYNLRDKVKAYYSDDIE